MNWFIKLKYKLIEVEILKLINWRRINMYYNKIILILKIKYY